MDTWASITALRTELIEQLAALPVQRWDEPTLCERWQVRHVVAHLTLPEHMSFFTVVGSLARAGFSLNRMIDQDAITKGSAPVPDVIEAYRDGIRRRTTPPTRTAEHLLLDLFTHAQDIRRPLGLPWSYQPEVLELVAGTAFADGRLKMAERAVGLRLVGIDTGWSVGTGPEVTGTTEALIMAMEQRPVALRELQGPGTETFASRMAKN